MDCGRIELAANGISQANHATWSLRNGSIFKRRFCDMMDSPLLEKARDPKRDSKSTR
jgi:hypothetical protein